MRLGLIVGSLSEQSINRRLLHGLQEIIADRADLVELSIAELPLYNRDLDDRFPPAALKNALEWGSRPRGQNAFPGTPAGIVGASTGRLGTALSQHQLREVLAYLDMPTLGQPEMYYTFNAADFDPETGAISDPAMYRRLGDRVSAFLEHIEKNPRRGT